MVHGEEVIFPEAVEDGEHDNALVVAHVGFAEDLFLERITLAKAVEETFAEFVTIDLSDVDFIFEISAEDIEDLTEEGVHLPLVGVIFGRSVLVEDVGKNGGGVVLGDELLLVDSFHELAAEAVDGFALLVHDVVVLEDVLAGFEVLGFDGFLRRLDAAGDHAAFDGYALFHAEGLE